MHVDVEHHPSIAVHIDFDCTRDELAYITALLGRCTHGGASAAHKLYSALLVKVEDLGYYETYDRYVDSFE